MLLRLRTILVAAVAATASLAGCTAQLNQDDDLLGGALPDLAGRMPATPAADVEPSLKGLHRDGWERVTVRVERRQVETHPSMATRLLYDHSTARERGEAPSETSVLEGPGCPGRAAAEGLSSPFVAALDILLMPVRLVTQPPTSVVRGPAPVCAATEPASHAAATGQPTP